MKIFFDYETGGVYDRKWSCVEAHEWKIIFDE